MSVARPPRAPRGRAPREAPPLTAQYDPDDPEAFLHAEGVSPEEAAAQSGAVIGGLRVGSSVPVGVANDNVMRDAVARLMGDVADPHFQATVEATLSEMAAGAGDSTAGGGARADPVADGHLAASVFSSLAAHSGAAGAESIAKTLELLTRMSGEVGGMPSVGGSADAASANGLPTSDSAQATEAVSDELIAKMQAEFEALGAKEDFGAVTDNMMRQLLAKDIMYVPMRSIAERFPAWLALNAEDLSKDVYENYGSMYQTFQKLVLTYETEPDNFPRILELMQDLQEKGNPPTDIIKELAPGLELTPEGMPMMMPNMGPGVAIPGALPGAGCTIM